MPKPLFFIGFWEAQGYMKLLQNQGAQAKELSEMNNRSPALWRAKLSSREAHACAGKTRNLFGRQEGRFLLARFMKIFFLTFKGYKETTHNCCA